MEIDTDYLIIGSGAVGMAFVDTLLDETDAHITIVDRHAAPGGHWNDAYPFVALHQPSAFYGVNSAALGTHRIDTHGPNAGFYELASGAEINAYFDRLMQQRFLPSGRVSYHPTSEYQGQGRMVSLLSGTATQITVRKKIVDTTFANISVPATHTPQFAVEEGIHRIIPNALPQLWMRAQKGEGPQQFCIVGAGKTAMDAAVWLLRNGVLPASIQWVVPRDSWLQNRLQTQPGMSFFDASIGGEASKMAAFSESTTIDEVFLKLEALGQMLRIDPSQTPTMFHYATISTGEMELLRTITRVIRLGRVKSITRDTLHLEKGHVAMHSDTLYVDCTASAVKVQTPQPVFQADRIVVQLLRMPLVTLSAAITAYVEAHGGDDNAKNRLCTPVPFPKDLKGYARATMMSTLNQVQWAQDKPLRQWMRQSRLDAFGKLVSEIDKDDADKQATLVRLRTNTMAAMSAMAAHMA